MPRQARFSAGPGPYQPPIITAYKPGAGGIEGDYKTSTGKPMRPWYPGADPNQIYTGAIGRYGSDFNPGDVHTINMGPHGNYKFEMTDVGGGVKRNQIDIATQGTNFHKTGFPFQPSLVGREPGGVGGGGPSTQSGGPGGYGGGGPAGYGGGSPTGFGGEGGPAGFSAGGPSDLGGGPSGSSGGGPSDYGGGGSPYGDYTGPSGEPMAPGVQMDFSSPEGASGGAPYLNLAKESQKGDTDVKGNPSTDNVPSLLSPREAVLNRNAAELLGRARIAALNAQGNRLATRGVDLAGTPAESMGIRQLYDKYYGPTPPAALQSDFSQYDTLGAQRGISSVPALGPAGAVLNRNAAEIIGHHKIRHANALGSKMAQMGLDLPSINQRQQALQMQQLQQAQQQAPPPQQLAQPLAMLQQQPQSGPIAMSIPGGAAQGYQFGTSNVMHGGLQGYFNRASQTPGFSQQNWMSRYMPDYENSMGGKTFDQPLPGSQPGATSPTTGGANQGMPTFTPPPSTFGPFQGLQGASNPPNFTPPPSTFGPFQNAQSPTGYTPAGSIQSNDPIVGGNKNMYQYGTSNVPVYRPLAMLQQQPQSGPIAMSIPGGASGYQQGTEDVPLMLQGPFDEATKGRLDMQQIYQDQAQALQNRMGRRPVGPMRDMPQFDPRVVPINVTPAGRPYFDPRYAQSDLRLMAQRGTSNVPAYRPLAMLQRYQEGSSDVPYTPILDPNDPRLPINQTVKQTPQAAPTTGKSDPFLFGFRNNYQKELQDPKVRSQFHNLIENEVGSSNPTRATGFVEGVMNRANARGQTLEQAINDKNYYPPQSFKPATVGSKTAALYDQHINTAIGGSNVSNFSTGNASGNVGFNGGPTTAHLGGGERAGLEGPDISWFQNLTGLKAPPPAQSVPYAPTDTATPAPAAAKPTGLSDTQKGVIKGIGQFTDVAEAAGQAQQKRAQDAMSAAMANLPISMPNQGDPLAMLKQAELMGQQGGNYYG